MKRIHRHKFILLLCLIAVLACVGVSFAAYTSVDNIRRVITTMQSSEMLCFYSNHMNPYPMGEDTEITTKIISFTDTDNPNIMITVCNYPQANPGRVNKRDIHYSFQALILDTEGNPLSEGALKNILSELKIERNGSGKQYSFSASANADVETSVSIVDGQVVYQSELLPGGVSSQNIYTIYLPAAYMEQVNIQVKAEPIDEVSKQATSKKALGRILSPILITNKGADWSGSFTDDLAVTKSKELYGINYAVSGAGEGNIKVMWNSEYLEISPNFMTMFSSYITEQGTDYVIMNVGGENSDDYFSIQFYRKKAAPETEGWNQNAGTGGSIVPDAGRTDGAYISYEFQPKVNE